MRLVFVPWDGAKMGRSSYTVGTFLRQNPAYSSNGGVNCKEDGSVRRVLDGDEGRWMDDSIFDGLHGSGMFIGPEKSYSFACEVYKGAGER
jgi:hypothetical protein